MTASYQSSLDPWSKQSWEWFILRWHWKKHCQMLLQQYLTSSNKRRNSSIAPPKGKGITAGGKGIRKPGERLPYRSCERSPSFQNAPNLCSTQTQEFKADPGEVINRIVVVDRWNDDTGGFMQITNGGINQDHEPLKSKKPPIPRSTLHRRDIHREKCMIPRKQSPWRRPRILIQSLKKGTISTGHFSFAPLWNEVQNDNCYQHATDITINYFQLLSSLTYL